MKGLNKKALSILLSLAMLGTSFTAVFASVSALNPVYAEESSLLADPATQEDVKKATEESAAAIKEYIKGEFGPSSVDIAFERLANLGDFAYGGFTVLEMLGIIEDPTTAELKQIMNILLEQSKQLNQLNEEMKSLSSQLKEIRIKQVQNQRALIADSYVNKWLDYKRMYLEKMYTNLNSYKSWVLAEVRNWSQDASKRNNIYVYYTDLNGQKYKGKAQTYSTATNMALEKADNGEVINKAYTVMLPKKYVDEALKNYKWNDETYRSVIVDALAKQIEKAMKDEQLSCSQSFKDSWKAAKEPEKKKIATKLAGEMLNSVAYNSSVIATQKNENEAQKMVSMMHLTWENTLDSKTGLTCPIEELKNTYSFEAETRAKMNNAFNSMTVLTSVYSIFNINLSSQLTNIGKERKQEAKNDYANGTKAIKARKTKEITNKDNYCYLTNSLVELKKYTIQGKSSITSTCYDSLLHMRVRKEGKSIWKWKVLDESGKEVKELKIAGYLTTGLIFETWNKTKAGKETFADFLSKRVHAGSYKGYSDVITTKYHGPWSFPLDKGVPMKCIDYAAKKSYKHCGDYFSIGGTYNIQTNGKRIENTNLHEMIQIDTQNTAVKAPAAGRIETKKMLEARAMYYHYSNGWYRDELWYFSDKSKNTSIYERVINTKTSEHYYTTSEDIYVLETKPLEGRKLEESEDTNIETIDATYKAHTDVSILSLNDWKKQNIEFLSKLGSDIELEKYVGEELDCAINKAAKEGKTVEMTTDQKKAFVKKIVKILSASIEEYSTNGNLEAAYIDPFNLYGNDAAMEKLAKLVLTDNEIADDGQTMEPVKNMITAAFYEPYVYLETEKLGDKYEIKPTLGYCVSPTLLVWDSQANCVKKFEISDEVMEQLGLSMRVRLSAAYAGNNNAAKVVHYDDVDSMKYLETKTAKLQGSGSNRYAEISVTRCSLFVPTFITVAEKTNTGDNNNVALYIFLGVLAVAGIGAVVYKKRNN